MQVIPQVFEKFNLRQMQEDINKRLDSLRDASISTSTERLQEATNQVKEILVKLKGLSEELETTLPRSLLVLSVISEKMIEITSNEKPTVVVKKRKSVRCSSPLFHSVVRVVKPKIPRLLEIQKTPRSRFVAFCCCFVMQNHEPRLKARPKRSTWRVRSPRSIRTRSRSAKANSMSTASFAAT